MSIVDSTWSPKGNVRVQALPGLTVSVAEVVTSWVSLPLLLSFPLREDCPGLPFWEKEAEADRRAINIKMVRFANIPRS